MRPEFQAGDSRVSDRRWDSGRTSRVAGGGVRGGLRECSSSTPELRPLSSTRRPFFSAVHHQEQVGQHDRRQVVVPAGPGSAFKVVQSQFAFHLAVTVFDPPAVLGRMNQSFQRCVRRQVRQKVSGGSIRIRRPFHQQPAGRLRNFAGTEFVCWSHEPGRESAGEFLPCSLSHGCHWRVASAARFVAEVA